jgi:uncharacterized membrane protein
MEKLIVVIFDDEMKANAGLDALRQLDRDGEISVYEARMIAKEPSGSIRFIDTTDELAFPVIAGATALGAFVGLLSGPFGVVSGGMTGGLISSIVHTVHLGVTDEFVNKVSAALVPGKFAMVADISEDQLSPLDTRMEETGCVVFRQPRSAVVDTLLGLDPAAHRAEMEQLKAERAQAKSDRLAKIDARIEALRRKLEDALERDRRKMLLRQSQREARIQALQVKADRAQGEVRRRLEARISEVRQDHKEERTNDNVESLVVIVFDDRNAALAGLEALRQLDREAEISLFAAKMVVRAPNGAVQLMEDPDDTDLSEIGANTTVGAFIGLLAGPVGLFAGAVAGALIGFGVELGRAGVTDEFVADVGTALTPGKVAVVADTMEDWMIPLNTRIEQLGGVVFRRTRTQVKQTQRNLDAAEHRAEMEQLRAERAKAGSDRLAQIDATIDEVRVKLEDALERDRRKVLVRQNQRDAKIQALKARADQSQGEMRRRIEARIADVRRDYEESAAGISSPAPGPDHSAGRHFSVAHLCRERTSLIRSRSPYAPRGCDQD